MSLTLLFGEKSSASEYKIYTPTYQKINLYKKLQVKKILENY